MKNLDPLVCKRCVMDSTAIPFNLDNKGNCNYCTFYLEQKQKNLRSEYTEKNFAELIEKVKSDGKNKKYDCIIGVSGGVDSSWVLVNAVRLGLRPLAVHMDNGWNSELAQNNISNLINELNVELYTHVIDWNEYRDLQKSFFKSNVVDIELLYDNALLGVNYSQSSKYGLKYIISGSNTATEGIPMPVNWAKNNKVDLKNIKNIWKKNGSNYKIKTFPGYGFNKFIYNRFFNGTTWIKFLDFLKYNKIEALEVLEKDFHFKPYPYKHYESIFTRFYQGYILPRKFNIDKRKNHLSALILNNEISREDALKILKKDPYDNPNDLKEDIDYFLKKFNWSEEKLTKYLLEPRKEHKVYGSENWKFDIYNFLKRKFFKK